ncbi:SDR family oxidoreductase [Rubellimicrobium rubrum]|uniref:SDR family oxidoreductase n=1 Tax=Rubellimicrobium rubrum TaxID=2585369 RepID=A0A5C4MJR0_9RHOB|nr:SDR family oxidoreductase [Rubellimicrobium rubrum]TNC43650.1 SDR family oxidoreductase [Rubellimicrobium rubrum]
MRIFVTGATGFVGSAVVEDLVAAGHAVLGLARSDDAAARLAAQGADICRGDITDHATLRAGAAEVDAVIHTAFNHDFSRFAASCEEDRQAIEVLGAALQGTDRQLLVTAGLAGVAPGRPSSEEDEPPTPSPAYPRASEQTARRLAARGLRASAVRLAPSVHDKGDHGFVPLLIEIAREKGASAYVGDGGNRWSAVHRRDAARVYRLALEHGLEAGPFQAAGEEAIPFRAIAEAIGQGLGLPVASLSPDEAQAHFGWFAHFASMDAPASSAGTRDRLGWEPNGPGLLADMREAGYFNG